eukprot:scaffold103001_cov58-Attheya_sp.AAC.2
MSSSSSESSASSSTSSILGTTEASNGKKRHVQFKKKSSDPVEDISDPNKTVTSTASPSVLSTTIVTNKDSVASSNSTVAHPSFPTGVSLDKAAVPVTKRKSRLPPISATTAEYMSKKTLAAQAKTKRTATASTGKDPTTVKKQKLVPIPIPKGPRIKKVALKTGYGKEIPLHVGVVPPEALTTIHGKEYLYGAIT